MLFRVSCDEGPPRARATGVGRDGSESGLLRLPLEPSQPTPRKEGIQFKTGAAGNVGDSAGPTAQSLLDENSAVLLSAG